MSTMEAPQMKPEDTQRATWQADAQWADELPKVQVTRPKGAFCQLDCTSLVGLHPGDVFEAMCDTGNQRIYRNAQGVRNRRVIEDTPEKKVVELEMLTSWKFMFLSGEFGVNVKITQDRPNHKLYFELSKPGFMKKFRGVWSVEAVPVPPSSMKLPERPSTAAGPRVNSALGRTASISSAASSLSPASLGRLSSSRGSPPEDTDILELALQAAEVPEGSEEGKDDSTLLVASNSSKESLPWFGKGTRLASKVILSQQVQPSLNPPPMFAHYLRGIAAKSIIEAMCDIQTEAARIRHGIPETAEDLHAELIKRGYTPLAVDVAGVVKKEEVESKTGFGRKRVGFRDWSVADGKKALPSRRSKRLSEKEKWKISKSLQDHLKKQCPTVRVAGQ